MHQYLAQLRSILVRGHAREDRTGTGTISIFGMQARYSLADSFPLVTTKRVFWPAVVGELLWMLEGSTDRNRLEQITYGTIGERSTIWDEWADDRGQLGPIYGRQWRQWGGGRIDQISRLIRSIETDPYSRRHIISAWNVADLPVAGLSPQENVQYQRMALAPCHVMAQFHVDRGRLSCQMYQRSADMFLGVPFNIASYALLTHMIAHVTGLEPGELIHTIGDAHIYANHIEQVREQIARDPRPLPRLSITKQTRDIYEIRASDIRLEGYDPHPAIKADVAI